MLRVCLLFQTLFGRCRLTNINDLVEQLNKELDECSVMAHMTRDSGLQREACDRLELLVYVAANYKEQAVSHQFEDAANLFLGFIYSALALRSQICMWLYLKQENPDNAWDCLVLAQRYADSAIDAHEDFSKVKEFRDKMEQIEKLVFPPQLFFSAGYVVQEQECSICGQDYGDCDHIAGRPYMGELCAIKAKGLQVDHTAVVTEPADKRCRAVYYHTEGGKRNRMTWKIEPLDESEDAGPDDGSMVVHAILAVVSDQVTLHRPWLAEGEACGAEGGV